MVSTSRSPAPPRSRSSALKSGTARWRTVSLPPAPPPGSPSVDGPVVPRSLSRPLEITLPLPPNLSVLSPSFLPPWRSAPQALSAHLLSSVSAPAQILFLAFPHPVIPSSPSPMATGLPCSSLAHNLASEVGLPWPHLTQFSVSAPPKYTCSSSRCYFSPLLSLCMCCSF